jgi:ADP-L-glycero-D-manno-heptose 6-epimerase
MIAVTGAAGFIGSNLAHSLAADGADLVLADHPLTAAKAANLVGLKQFRFLEHDRFLDSLDALAPDAVYHLGACSATTELNWDYLKKNNVEYTQQLWNWCAKNRKPFVYASSAATYGDGALGFDDRLDPSSLKPLNLYGKSKNDFDIWALAQPLTPPRWAGVKFFNVYGPRESHKGRMASVAFQTFKQIRATGGMKLFRSTDPKYADGGQLRDFVFVNDCVNHLRWLATHEHPGGLYNSGTARARSFHDLAAAVFKALRLEANISFIDMPADLAKQYQNFTQATSEKLRLTGYDAPVTALESGVEATVDWLSR